MRRLRLRNQNHSGEEGNHRAASIACACVVNDGFNTVADFDTVFAIVGGKKQ